MPDLIPNRKALLHEVRTLSKRLEEVEAMLGSIRRGDVDALATSAKDLLEEVQATRARLEEVEDTLRAIRSGEVDALVVSGPEGERIYSLKGAEQPYRAMVETMSEGAVTFAPDGTILYCNQRFGELVKTSLENVTGSALQHFIDPADQEKLAALLTPGDAPAGTAKISLTAADGAAVPVRITTRRLDEFGVDSIVGVITDLTDFVAAEKKLREMSIRDALTGLFNRRYLDETLERELARADREGRPVSVVMMDIDRFKEVNDAFGHRAGDAMLQRLGELLRTQTRLGDVACRYGGEEFVMVLPDMPLETACQRAEAWRVLVDGLRVAYGGVSLHVTLSMGVAAYPVSGRTADAVLTAADNALYTAKAGGRNRIAVAGQDQPPEK
jgi:diguanylate cyclase (GGDEF)-like protein/PAS domain S-box-containing protein